MKIKMFGLLYLKEGERSIVNLKIKDFQDQISVYVNNALSLSRSLQMRGIPFTLLTNDKSLVDEYIPSDNGGKWKRNSIYHHCPDWHKFLFTAFQIRCIPIFGYFTG